MNTDIILIDDEVIVIVDYDDNNEAKRKSSRKRKADTDDMIIDNDDFNFDRKKKYKKKYISSTVKRLVWNKWIGEEIGKYKCLCCNITYITQLSFHAGHIVSEFNGGETAVSNLKPICQNCNSSMGTRNMNDFMKTLK